VMRPDARLSEVARRYRACCGRNPFSGHLFVFRGWVGVPVGARLS
jgi:hypothetical protein